MNINEMLNWFMQPISVPLVLALSVVLMCLIGYYQYMITYPVKWTLMCIISFLTSVAVMTVWRIESEFNPQVIEEARRLWDISNA